MFEWLETFNWMVFFVGVLAGAHLSLLFGIRRELRSIHMWVECHYREHQTPRGARPFVWP